MLQHRLACCTTPQLRGMQDWWEYRKWRRLVEEEDHSTVSFVHCLCWHSLKSPHPSLSPGTLTPHSPGTLTPHSLQAPSPLTPQAPSPLTLQAPSPLTLQAPSPLTLQAPSPLTLQAPSLLTLFRHPHSPTPAQMENPLYEGLHKEVVNPLFDDADDELEDMRILVHFKTNLGFEDD